jgi:hypothetical protein
MARDVEPWVLHRRDHLEYTGVLISTSNAGHVQKIVTTLS